MGFHLQPTERQYRTSQQRGALYAIGAGFCYGLVGFFGMSIINAEFSVPAMLFWRFFVASAFMAVLLIPQYRQVLQLNRQSIQAFLYGMLFYGTSTTAYFLASLYIGTGLAMVIFFTFPAFVMLINTIIYKTAVKKIYYLAFSLISGGLIFLANPDSLSFDVYGIGLSMLSAILYAFYIATSKRITVPPMLSTFMVSLGCMMTSLVFAVADASLTVPLTVSSWIDIIAMGLVCTAIPILLLLQCFKYISSEKASMLTVLEPVFVVIFGILLLDEELTVTKLCGIIIILSGALITLFNDKPQEDNAITAIKKPHGIHFS